MAKRIKSGIKRVEIAERNRQRNIAVKSTIKTAVRKTLEALSGSEANGGELFVKAQSQLDKAAVKGVLHKNAVARRTSRLAKRVNAAAAAAAAK
jgi:small subunit ribosomal protein S20